MSKVKQSVSYEILNEIISHHNYQACMVVDNKEIVQARDPEMLRDQLFEKLTNSFHEGIKDNISIKESQGFFNMTTQIEGEVVIIPKHDLMEFVEEFARNFLQEIVNEMGEE